MSEFHPEDRVELIRTDDPNTGLRPGDRGTVAHVDGLGCVHIAWDSGATLGMLSGEGDRFRILEPAPAQADPHPEPVGERGHLVDLDDAYEAGPGRIDPATTEGKAILDLHGRLRALSGADEGPADLNGGDTVDLVCTWLQEQGIDPSQPAHVVREHLRHSATEFTVFALLDNDTREVTVVALGRHHLHGPKEPVHITVSAANARDAADLAAEALTGSAEK